MAIFRVGARFGVDMDTLDLDLLFTGRTTLANTGIIYVDGAFGDRVALFGNFSYDATGKLAGGALFHIQENGAGFLRFDVSDFSVSATRIVGLADSGDMQEAFSIVLNGPDSLIGASHDDVLRGY